MSGPREQLHTRVASAIRVQITNRAIRPGDFLRLDPLASELGVSVTPVREALLLLTQDGWVMHEANRGFRVAPIRRSDVEDTYLMWSTAEGEVAARAATRATARDVANLRSLDERIREADPSDGELATALNADLHEAIAEIADAPKLDWFNDAARRLIPFQFPESFHVVPGWAEVNRKDHVPIIDSIAAGETGVARTLMSEHYRKTGDLLLSWLDSLDLWSDPDTSVDQVPRSPRRLAG